MYFLFFFFCQWMGFGPEEMKIPDTFEIPVSSFSQYGGHASICIRYDSQTLDLYYKQGSDDGTNNSNSKVSNNIAYLQVGVPEYRISQMVKNGGNILDAYGVVNVISPSGLPMRGIVGISPDPMMFVALNCLNVRESRDFYAQLGFVEQVGTTISVDKVTFLLYGMNIGCMIDWRRLVIKEFLLLRSVLQKGLIFLSRIQIQQLSFFFLSLFAFLFLW